jgi:hypothetical protein
MAWQDDMVTMLRVVIDDAGSNPTYSNSRLEEVIVVAAHLTKQAVDFDNDYTVDIQDVSITPDPVNAQDYSFINLVILKAGCVLANSEYKTDGARAISVRDGSASVDQRGVADAKKNWRDMICSQYDKAEREYRMGNSQAGEAIIGPYMHRGDYGGQHTGPRFRNP